MARTPNYSAERAERDRAKARKTAEKAALKQAQRQRGGESSGDEDSTPADSDTPRD